MDASRHDGARLGHTALVTADLDRFRRFYEDVFGFRTVMVDHPDGMPFRRLASMADAVGDDIRLLLFEVPGYASGLPDDVIGRRGRLDHVAVHIGEPDGFDDLVGRLVECGASSGEISELGPVRSVLFVDPDGGHHNLQTPNPEWVPPRSVEIVDPALWARGRGDGLPTA
jgi:catechol 2,3-dioxygenase-like lactoylglutathione lyase family enzyme